MKILVFIHSMSAGGAERVTSILASRWAAAGHQVTLVTQTPDTEDFYEVHPSVIRISLNSRKNSHGTWSAISNNLKRIRALGQVIRIVRPKTVIGMMTASNVLVTLATLRTGIPVIVCERTYPPQLPVGIFWNILRRWTYPLASRVIMLTSEGVEWLRREIPHAKGLVIPNPVHYPLPVNTPALLPTNLPSERRILLAVGRMSEEKGFSGLIQAFSELAKECTNWDLVILGDGPLRPVLEQQVQAAALQTRILLPGKTGDMGAWYKRSDLYVLSSRVEGFPNSLAEAMAHGCAVVSFDCDTGPRDLIRHGVDGLLVPAGDFKALKLALENLMGNDKLRTELAVRAVEIRDRYSIQRVLELWNKLFDELIPPHDSLK